MPGGTTSLDITPRVAAMSREAVIAALSAPGLAALVDLVVWV